MEQSLPRCRDVLFCSEFKKAMWELCKNKGLSFVQAEKSMGFKDGFIESVEKGIYKLTLEDVRKIAGYFHTTMDSVLDGGKVERRVYTRGVDELGYRQSEECLKAYAELLDEKAMDHWKKGLFLEQVNDRKLKLEKCERAFIEHYKAHMEEVEAKDRAREIVKCEDDVLVRELLRRGFKVEKDGE